MTWQDSEPVLCGENFQVGQVKGFAKFWNNVEVDHIFGATPFLDLCNMGCAHVCDLRPLLSGLHEDGLFIRSIVCET